MPIPGAPTGANDEPASNLGAERPALPIVITLRFGGAEYFAVPEAALSMSETFASHVDGSGEAQLGRLDLEGRKYLLYDSDTLRKAGLGANSAHAISEILTRREVQIALMIAEGKCDKAIAHSLGISGYTVREHVRRISHKLRVANRCAIVAYILTNGEPSNY